MLLERVLLTIDFTQGLGFAIRLTRCNLLKSYIIAYKIVKIKKQMNSVQFNTEFIPNANESTHNN